MRSASSTPATSPRTTTSTHQQTPGRPWASAAGQICAGRGNAWIGGAASQPTWQPSSAIDSWMESAGHRLWLLYPTTPTFGFGFYTASNNRAGAALNVLSLANLDSEWAGWPLRYPAANQIAIPATAYPITLNWPYFGPAPTLTSSALTTAAGQAIAHRAVAELPAGHKGIQITPSAALPDNTVFTVTVSGTYSGAPFTHSWRFSTGDQPIK